MPLTQDWRLSAIAVAICMFLLNLSTTESVATGQETAAVSGPLDGLSFVGKLKSADGSIELDDTLHFSEGHFWSAGCIRCSFMPGAYWSRTAGSSTEFHGVLESPERGSFTYRGRVQDGRVEVKIYWLRERWYWTVDRDYVFEGRVEENDGSAISLSGARQRASQDASPTCPI